MDKVIGQSPWPLAKKMLFLKPWRLDVSLRKEDMETLRIWSWIEKISLLYMETAIC